MVNYNNSLIYKLCCNNPTITDIYVGSTTNFIQRKRNHKSSCNNENGKYYNRNVYCFIRENGGWSNWSMVQIEQYNCNDKRELETRERYWLEELKATLNSRIPTRTDKEYRENDNNKKQMIEYKKEYYENNKEKYKQKVNCDICNKQITKYHMLRHKRTHHNTD